MTRITSRSAPSATASAAPTAEFRSLLLARSAPPTRPYPAAGLGGCVRGLLAAIDQARCGRDGDDRPRVPAHATDPLAPAALQLREIDYELPCVGAGAHAGRGERCDLAVQALHGGITVGRADGAQARQPADGVAGASGEHQADGGT